jgi:hypothetical protein
MYNIFLKEGNGSYIRVGRGNPCEVLPLWYGIPKDIIISGGHTMEYYVEEHQSFHVIYGERDWWVAYDRRG